MRVLVLVALIINSPLIAQRSLSVAGIPWGIQSPQFTANALRLGWAEAGAIAESHIYTDAAGCQWLASISDLDGLQFLGADCTIPTGITPFMRFRTVRDSLQALYGAPTRQSPDESVWERGGARLSVAYGGGQSSSDPYYAITGWGPHHRSSTLKAIANEAFELRLRSLGSRWARIGETENAAVFLDHQSLTAGSARGAWTRHFYRRPQEHGRGISYDEVREHSRYQCANRLTSLVSILYYLDGVLVQSRGPFATDEWESPVPESIGEAILNAVCAQRR